MGSIGALRIITTISAVVSWIVIGIGGLMVLVAIGSGNGFILLPAVGVAFFGFIMLASAGLLTLGLAVYDRLGMIHEALQGGHSTAASAGRPTQASTPVSAASQPRTPGPPDGAVRSYMAGTS